MFLMFKVMSPKCSSLTFAVSFCFRSNMYHQTRCFDLHLRGTGGDTSSDRSSEPSDSRAKEEHGQKHSIKLDLRHD